ncbi:MAG: tetratricopeptide repeat protein, partial [Candidatus Heimdallarchaeota archaeon]|nr:tetratricopeptide repeat protein [Candidatus Heimdallarchaeota archaeon]
MVVEEILEFSKRGEFNKVLSTYNEVNVATLSIFDRFQIQLELAYTYCRSGYIRKTFREINKINSDPEWSKFENNYTLSIRYNIVLGLTYLKRGDYKKSVLYYEEAYLQALSSQKVEFVADTIIRLGSHCFFTLDFDLALDKFEEAYKLAKSVGAQDLAFESLDWIGYIHLYLGNFEKAEKFCQEAFDLANEIGHSKGLADIQMDLGAINYVQGNLSLALEKYNESLWQYIENGDYDSTAWIHLKVGELHTVRGAFGISLINYYKALRLYEELQLNGGIGISLLSVGRVYLDMDEIEEASSFINKGMDILHGIENPSALKFGLWTFLNLNIIEGNIDTAYEIFDQLTAIDSKSEKDPIGEMYLRHSKALLLKSSKRAREKYQSQELFKSIIDDNIASAWIKMDALKHLLELLIMEYHNFKEPEVLKILEECLDHMIEFSDTQELVPSIVEANRLKSIFLQDLGDTETANLCLEKAYETAQSNHYSWLSKKLL